MRDLDNDAMGSAISIIDLSFYRDDTIIIEHLNLRIAAGICSVIMGPSGSGKTTFLKLLAGLLSPTDGKIVFENALKKPTTAFVFQNAALFDSLTILENITFAWRRQKIKDKAYRAAQLLEEVGLTSDILPLYPANLSGGMQKRVAIARALAQEPSILFLDEPTAGLDHENADRICSILQRLKSMQGCTMVVATHSQRFAREVGDFICSLAHGVLQPVDLIGSVMEE
jgi:phospholipid/cholesterol/gamma-HCH transport system ATP-binding protein